MNEISKIIKALTDLSVSQQEIADYSGLTQGRISQLLSGGTCAYEKGRKLSDLLVKTQRKAARGELQKPVIQVIAEGQE